MLSQCRVVLPSTVVGEAVLVARQFDDISLRLETEVAEGLVSERSLEASDLRIVSDCCPKFPGKMDPGELECLACLLHDPPGTSLLCSSDAVVFRYLGWVQRHDDGISLEEVLRGIGLGHPVPPQFRKTFRESWGKKGFAEAVQCGFIKP